MNIFFYDHLIIVEELLVVLNTHKVTGEHREKILSYYHEMLHHTIIENILSELPIEHHEQFLSSYTKEPHNKGILRFITEKTGKNIEEKIKQIGIQVIKSVTEEIQKARKKANFD